MKTEERLTLEEFTCKVKEITKALNFDQIDSDGDFKSHILDSQGRRLCISYDMYKNERIFVIDGDYPTDMFGEYVRSCCRPSSIRVSADKAAKLVAKDIQCRIIPYYDNAIVDIQISINKIKESYKRRLEMAEAVSAIIDDPYEASTGRFYFSVKDDIIPGLDYIKPCSSEKLEIELSLNKDQAVQVLTLLKTIANKEVHHVKY